MMRLYHTSDLHDRRGIAEPLAAMRAQEPGLLFDSGDSLRGSQTVYYRNEPIIAELDAARYDAQAVGNREFHYLYGCMRARAARMRHPLVCSNLIDLKGRRLPFESALRIGIEDGRQAHVLGLLVRQYPQGSPWERIFGWRFLDPQTIVAERAAASAADDLLIVLSHLGLARDRELAHAVPRIDVILGGHSHDTLQEPAIEAQVPIIHAGPYGRFVSRSEFSLASGAEKRWQLQAFELVPLLRS